MSWWRGVRKTVLPGGHRPMGEKFLSLAEFMASRDEGTTWEQDREAWNASGIEADWRYDLADRRNFWKAAQAAHRRLLSCGYQMPRE
jgi:hypothetical protein